MFYFRVWHSFLVQRHPKFSLNLLPAKPQARNRCCLHSQDGLRRSDRHIPRFVLHRLCATRFLQPVGGVSLLLDILNKIYADTSGKINPYSASRHAYAPRPPAAMLQPKAHADNVFQDTRPDLQSKIPTPV